MEKFGKTIGIQLLIMAAYLIFSKATSMLGINIAAIFLQVVICLAISIFKFVKNDSATGAHYMISAFVVLIIGVGSCVAMMGH